MVPESVVAEKFMTSCECVSGRRANSENTSTVLPAPLDPTTRAFLLAPQRVPRTNEFRICVAFASRRHKKFENAQIGTGRIWGGGYHQFTRKIAWLCFLAPSSLPR